MKELWMRVGVTFKITDEEACLIFNGCSTDLSNIIEKAMEEGRYTVEGETYVPECSIYNFNQNYGTTHEQVDIECLM